MNAEKHCYIFNNFKIKIKKIFLRLSAISRIYIKKVDI